MGISRRTPAGNDESERPLVDRRAVLGAGAMAGVGLALGGCTSGGSDADAAGATTGVTSGATSGAPTTAAQSGDFDSQDWDSVRAQFSLDPKLAHFAAFVFASHPAPVAAAIERHRARFDADPEAYEEVGVREETKVRAAAAAYLDVRANDIALTDSTTMGLGVLYGGMRLSPRDEVLTTTHDFYSTTESLSLAAKRNGAAIKHVTLYDNPAQADVGQMVDRLVAGITPRTRVVAVTWVHSGTGVRIPVTEIAAAVADANNSRSPDERALLCVDGVHGFGLMNQSIPDLGCDFLSAGTHKWLMGPRGTGFVWGRAWDRVDTAIPTFSAPHFAPGPHASPGGFHTFEHRWAVKEAFEFHNAIGSDRILERTVDQATQLKEGLAALPNVTVVTPMSPDVSAGIVCLKVKGSQPWDAVPELRKRHQIVGSITPYNNPYLRLGPSIVTNPDQVDKAIAAVAALT